MKFPYLPLAVLIFAVVVIAAVPYTILPLFSQQPVTCKDAEVVIYNGDYNEVSQEVTLDIRNQGKKSLELEVFVTASDGKVSKYPDKRIFLSPEGKGIFTLSDVTLKPQEVTVRDIGCNIADLWKF